MALDSPMLRRRTRAMERMSLVVVAMPVELVKLDGYCCMKEER
jgi:hypothetical protein